MNQICLHCIETAKQNEAITIPGLKVNATSKLPQYNSLVVPGIHLSTQPEWELGDQGIKCPGWEQTRHWVCNSAC